MDDNGELFMERASDQGMTLGPKWIFDALSRPLGALSHDYALRWFRLLSRIDQLICNLAICQFAQSQTLWSWPNTTVADTAMRYFSPYCDL
jgi:hypothetical protein